MAAPYKVNRAKYGDGKVMHEKHLIAQNNKRIKNIMYDIAQVQDAKAFSSFDRLVRKTD